MSGVYLSLKSTPVWFSGDDELFEATELVEACPGKEARHGLKFLIRPVSRKMIHRALTRWARVEKIEGKAETRETLDREGFFEDMLDQILLDWEGLLDAEGQALPCVRENKLKLADAYPRLGASVLEAAARAMTLAGQRTEQAEKN